MEFLNFNEIKKFPAVTKTSPEATMIVRTPHMILKLHQQIWVLKLATNNALYNHSSLAFWELNSTWFAVLCFNIQSLDWIHLGVEIFFIIISEAVIAAYF